MSDNLTQSVCQTDKSALPSDDYTLLVYSGAPSYTNPLYVNNGNALLNIHPVLIPLWLVDIAADIGLCSQYEPEQD